jgi:hypothetical protein
MFTHMPKSWFEWMKAQTGLRVSEEFYADMKATATIRMGQILMNGLAEDLDPAERRGWVGRFEKTKTRIGIVAEVLDDDEKACLERGN